MRIDLGTRQFNTLVPDVNGTTWLITDMEGWDAPALRQSFQGPSGRHGNVLLESLLDNRPVILRGIAKSNTEAQFWAAYNGILGDTNNLRTTRTLRVYESVAKVIQVIRGGQPSLRFKGVGAFEFELPLIALDPVKYTDSQKTGVTAGSFTMTNDGNFESYPIFTVSAPGTVIMDNLTDPDLDVLTTGAKTLPVGTVLDFNKRTVVNGGISYFQSLASSSVFWKLLPGVNTIASTGTASLTYSFRDAWI